MLNKYIRIFNQNRFSILIGVIILILIFSIIQVLNNSWKQKEKEEIEKVESSINETEDKNGSGSTLSKSTSSSVSSIGTESVISDTKLPDEYKSKFNSLIRNFINNCFNQKYDEAYNSLTVDCKKEMFPSKEIFIDKYCSERFVKGKKAQVNLWGTNGGYVYQVKLINDILAEGRGTSSVFMQDYYSVIEQNGEFKLNINGFLGKLDRNKSGESGKLKITVN